MDKWDILQKNLEDTGDADEREKLLQYKASSIAFMAMMITWLAVAIFNFCTGQPVSQISIIVFTGMTAMWTYCFINTREKRYLGGAIAAGIATLAWIISYVMQVLGA